MVEHWSAESEDLRFDSSQRIRILSLSHVRDKTKKKLLHFIHVQNNIVVEMLVMKGQLFLISSPWVKNWFYRLRENVIHLKITAVYSFYFTREVDILYPVLYLNFEEKPNGGF